MATEKVRVDMEINILVEIIIYLLDVTTLPIVIILLMTKKLKRDFLHFFALFLNLSLFVISKRLINDLFHLRL